MRRHLATNTNFSSVRWKHTRSKYWGIELTLHQEIIIYAIVYVTDDFNAQAGTNIGGDTNKKEESYELGKKWTRSWESEIHAFKKKNVVRGLGWPKMD